MYLHDQSISNCLHILHLNMEYRLCLKWQKASILFDSMKITSYQYEKFSSLNNVALRIEL